MAANRGPILPGYQESRIMNGRGVGDRASRPKIEDHSSPMPFTPVSFVNVPKRRRADRESDTRIF